MTRSHDKNLEIDEVEIWYVNDYPEGVVVECHPPQGCGLEFKLPHKTSETEDDKCPQCGKFLVCRPWCEW